MRHLFIINPAAGKRGTTAQLEALLEKLTFPHKVMYTGKEGDARRFTQEAARPGEPVRIYACGGDGTLNEVVNGAAGLSHVAVTNVPKGTGNDFLKIFGPHYRTLFYDLEALAVGPQTPFDLIDCNGRLGIDVVCAGVDARIAADVHRYKDWRFVSGMGAYVLALLENIFFKGIARPISVHMGDIHWEDRPASLLCVCNGRYYGGGFMPVGEAMPDDGVLDRPGAHHRGGGRGGHAGHRLYCPAVGEEGEFLLPRRGRISAGQRGKELLSNMTKFSERGKAFRNTERYIL